MPFAGAAEKLGAAFGINFTNGYVRDETSGPDVFQRTDDSLRNHPITNGRNAAEKVEAIATFTGSAFQVPNAQPLLVLGASYVSWLTSTAGQFPPTTPRESVSGWLQGAVFNSGKGRVAVFGEAAMFSAQLAGVLGLPFAFAAQPSPVRWSQCLPDAIATTRTAPDPPRRFSSADGCYFALPYSRP